MSSVTIFKSHEKYNVTPVRVHDYLYDSSYIVSGARDYARAAFKAALGSAQVVIQPVYNTMFSELRKFPRVHVLYHPNCRLPSHVDRSYSKYVEKTRDGSSVPQPQLSGRDRFMFSAMPKKVLPLHTTTPDFRPPSSRVEFAGPTRPVNRGVQTKYRESSAQTHPWQPDARPAEGLENTPEVMYLDNLEWGPGNPYRLGDLPVDFHTTEIINKMRHARYWNELVEKGQYPKWMKKSDAVITDVETRDWIFREAEIDELQDIRLSLLHKLQADEREKKTTRLSKQLDKLWEHKKDEMGRKISNIHRTRDRELRKLAALHGSGGRVGLVQRMRTARGSGPVTAAARDPASDLYAPIARNGYQARRRHAKITYDVSLLQDEDHAAMSALPPWLDQCGSNLKKSCSGHYLPKDQTQLCERETKWSEKFLENLHNELKKARLGAAGSTAAPLRFLKPRREPVKQRPPTPEVDPVEDADEVCHQSAVTLQRIIKGRAVQNLMYEGRSRATELIEELKSTHGLQTEDKVKIAKEESKARDYYDNRSQADKKEAAISALVEELCGSAVSSALDFLEKELRRLKVERRQHAFLIVALREKTMREAAEAGRRQKEEHRRREHDEMFKRVLGMTQETVDVYLKEIIDAGVEIAAETDAVNHVKAEADRIDASLEEYGSMSTAEQNEMVAELVHQFLLPEAHKAAAIESVNAVQKSNLGIARKSIFGLLDDAEIKEVHCVICGQPLGKDCICNTCPIQRGPVEKPEYRNDPRWKYTKTPERPREKTMGEKFPPYHDFRCMLNTLVDEVVVLSRGVKADRVSLTVELDHDIKEMLEVTLDTRGIVHNSLERALGLQPPPPIKELAYHYYMKRDVRDALERTEPFFKRPCPDQLPSEIRREADQLAALVDPSCKCGELRPSQMRLIEAVSKEVTAMLPSELRVLEDLKRCKCDSNPAPTPVTSDYEGILEEEFDDDLSVGYRSTAERSDIE